MNVVPYPSRAASAAVTPPPHLRPTGQGQGLGHLTLVRRRIAGSSDPLDVELRAAIDRYFAGKGVKPEGLD